jgi:pimeloyl-ACP methyl ester carboxylesterase
VAAGENIEDPKDFLMLLKGSLSALAALAVGASGAQASPIKSIVLVHGAFVDGSGWKDVADVLRRDGYNVSVVQNPTGSLDEDVAYAKHAVDAKKGKVVLVGHSYGGAVITEAGNDPNVAALVYIAAFAPDAGESVGVLSSKPAPDASKPPILPPEDGFLSLDKSKFREAFAADVKPSEAEFMAISQNPWGLKAVNGTIENPAWKNKPTWYVVAKNDRMIPPSLERMMAKRANAHTFELAGSHAVFMSKPDAVVSIIEKAAHSAGGETN